MRYPRIEPHKHGMLDVGDGQLLYWEVCGNPAGKPVVVLHGGPGSGCSPSLRQLFDPRAYRVVLFDQRGAGRSLPHASEHGTDLSVNTTDHLVGDVELLREHLGIPRWQVFGVSWGATLALVYAQRYPDHVTEIVLGAVTVTCPSDIDWRYHGLRRFFPAQWEAFAAGVPDGGRHGDLVEAYARMLGHADPAIRAAAARAWCAWESAAVSLEIGGVPDAHDDDPRFRMAFARLVTHYFRHGAWLADGQLLRDAHLLAGIPGILVHGRLDLGSPPATAWDLAQAWPGSELILVAGGGHSDLGEHLAEATDRFATA